jgi:hypothetical protein
MQRQFSVQLPGGNFNDLDFDDIALTAAQIARQCDVAHGMGLQQIEIFVTGVMHGANQDHLDALDRRIRLAIDDDVREVGKSSNLYCGNVVFILRL